MRRTRLSFFDVLFGNSVPMVPKHFMATVKPFRALRPKPELASQVCELPYDVMSSEEARQVANGNKLSFLHVSKPEIDLPQGIDPYASAVYQKGRENFETLLAGGIIQKDSKPCFYLYQQIMGTHRQAGIVAVASCEDYSTGTIKKHELTRPEKEDDRVRHIESLNAQTGPVFLTYRACDALDEISDSVSSGRPALDFVANDGVRHTSWVIDDVALIRRIEDAFASISFLYIADGHHRSAAAMRVWQSRNGAGQSGSFLAVLFPHDQMRILPYNRVLRDLNGLNGPQLLDKLDQVFVIRKGGGGKTSEKHELGLYLEGAWHLLRFRLEFVEGGDAKDGLDVTLLQKLVLSPVFQIEDPRTSQRISFVGGIRGTQELERLVNSGEYACAFSMFPTGIEDLMAIADSNGLMPPKSTWFEPKLRDGMFCHQL